MSRAVRSPALAGRQFRGRRLGDPVDIATAPGTRAVRGRLAAVSVRAAVAAGAWVGFALGLVFGAVIGATLVWFAGAVVDWQRDLAFTLGVARRLLPFGDQLGLLRDIEARWWLVIPGVAVGVAAMAALIGALLGGIFAALYNRSPRHALVVVELPTAMAPPQTVEPAAAVAPPQSAEPAAAMAPPQSAEPATAMAPPHTVEPAAAIAPAHAVDTPAAREAPPDPATGPLQPRAPES